MKTFFFAFPVAALVAFLVTVTAPNGRWPPAHACTLLYPAIETAVPQSDAVVVVKALSVGGPVNDAPTQTPNPGLASNPNGRGTPIISLEGLGATLAVEHVLAGSLPSQVNVDEEARQATERAIRTLEANPGYVAPCSLDIGLLRWVADARYVVFLNQTEDGRWSAALRWQISGSNVIVEGNPSLIVGDETYFAGISVQAYFSDQEPWFFTANTVPLQSLLAAIRDIEAGLFPLPTELPDADSPAPPRPERGGIIPPTTGDAGLR